MTIADKIIPSFYIIDIEGKAIESIISGDFGIEKINIGSKDFKNDMDATAALSSAMIFISINPDLDLSQAKEKIDYNPEFFPTLRPLSLTEEQKTCTTELEEIAKEMNEPESNEVAIPITRNFDQLGDFVESRWALESTDFKVLGKVVVNPDEYVTHKAIDEQIKLAHRLLKRPNQLITLH